MVLNLKGKISLKRTFQIFLPEKKNFNFPSIPLISFSSAVSFEARFALILVCSHLGVNVIKILLSIVVL